MTIDKVLDGTKLSIALTGRLDTTTSPEFEKVLKESISGVQTLILDFANLEYISSAGLRVLLATQKTMNVQGSMIIRNVSSAVEEIFDVTGFVDILTIE